jgi:hypothetical protein
MLHILRMPGRLIADRPLPAVNSDTRPKKMTHFAQFQHSDLAAKSAKENDLLRQILVGT